MELKHTHLNPTNLLAKPSPEHTDPAELDSEALVQTVLGHF